jgi:WD40 repeat protein
VVAAFASDGRHFAAGDNNGAVHVWDAETGEELNNIALFSR